MNRDLFHQILSTGFIRGHCNKAVIYFDSRDLHCDFISDDRTMICNVVSEKFNDGNNFIGERKLGLPNVESFLKMIKTMGKEVDVKVEHEGRDEYFMILDDDMLQMKYGLISNSQMPKRGIINPSDMSANPFELSVDKEFITKFHKLSGADKDCKYLFVTTDEKNLDLIISQTEDYNTGVKLSYPMVEGVNSIRQLKFNIKQFRMVLYNNRTATSGKIFFHAGGLCVVEFIYENIMVKYYIISE